MSDIDPLSKPSLYFQPYKPPAEPEEMEFACWNCLKVIKTTRAAELARRQEVTTDLRLAINEWSARRDGYCSYDCKLQAAVGELPIRRLTRLGLPLIERIAAALEALVKQRDPFGK